MSNLPPSLSLNRRHFLNTFGGAGAAMILGNCKTVPTESAPVMLRQPRLPWSVVFKGEPKFHRLCEQAKRENWASQPIGERTVTAGKALCGTPYGNYTLEIDNKIESPSVNFDLLDCWTFYEASLALARLVKNPSSQWTARPFFTTSNSSATATVAATAPTSAACTISRKSSPTMSDAVSVEI